MNGEIKLDLSNGKMNINEQLIEQGYRLSEKYEKIALNEIKLLKLYDELNVITKERSKRRIDDSMDFIILNAEEVQE